MGKKTSRLSKKQSEKSVNDFGKDLVDSNCIYGEISTSVVGNWPQIGDFLSSPTPTIKQLEIQIGNHCTSIITKMEYFYEYLLPWSQFHFFFLFFKVNNILVYVIFANWIDQILQRPTRLRYLIMIMIEKIKYLVVWSIVCSLLTL